MFSLTDVDCHLVAICRRIVFFLFFCLAKLMYCVKEIAEHSKDSKHKQTTRHQAGLRVQAPWPLGVSDLTSCSPAWESQSTPTGLLLILPHIP